MQESVHCRLFTAATFTWRAKLFVECRMVDPKMVSQFVVPQPCATTCRHCLHIARLSFSKFPLESFFNPKYFHTAALRFVGLTISSTSFDAIKIMPRVVVQKSHIITESVMLTLVYWLTITALQQTPFF